MRFLVVDDDYVSRVKLATFFNPLGQCDNAPSGQIALQLFEIAHKDMAPYDIITMDVEMPDLSGNDTVAKIRDLEQKMKVNDEKKAKILMVTVKKEVKEVFNSYKQGCTWFTSKPISPTSLKKAMEEMGYTS